MGDDDKKTNVSYGVLPNKLGGGPCGLGDPNDRSLRKVEKDILIMQKLRDKTRAEKCVQEVKEFTECCKDSSILMVVKCRKENAALKSCCERWYTDKKFLEECKQEYLDERSEYRRTGITKKQKEYANRLKTSM